MTNDTLNKKWKEDYFKIFATTVDNREELENADKIKIEHFPPVLGQYYPDSINENDLKELCQGKLSLSKSKLSYYNDSIIKTDYEKIVKTQLNTLMEQQIAKLQQEDPHFLKDDEKEIIKNSSFPFIKLMTLVYSKDTNEMSKDDQKQWKEYMNHFITQQIVFVIVNTYYTMKLYLDNIYTTTFQTPYNKEYVWNKYGNNQKSICVAYDFKEITETTVKQLQKIYPLFYVKEDFTKSKLDYEVLNPLCVSLFKSVDTINEYDNEWSYVLTHKYTETEYTMLDNLLEPVYRNSMEYPKITEILHNDYLEINDTELNYNYQKLIDDLLNILESEEFTDQINDKLQEVYNITSEDMTIDFMKPEAIYFGKDFPEDKIESFKEIIEKEDVRVFRIKQSGEKLFKALI